MFYMIILKVRGGLGNQLFEYALGRTLALRNNVALKLDTSEFKTFEFPHYTMEKFNIQTTKATQEEIDSLERYRPRRGILGLILNPLFADARRYVIEADCTFAPELLELKAPCMLDGYWQSEKYFLDAADILRQEFTLRNPLSAYSKTIAAKIAAAKNSVSLHVRRGDMATDPGKNLRHGLCPIEYYEAAERIIGTAAEEPTFFIFSDDIEWARKNITPGFPTEYVVQKAEKNFEDMELMRLCKHHIIANSSLSWWGAWLSDHYRTGITIAPKRQGVKFYNKDFLPSHWTVLPF